MNEYVERDKFLEAVGERNQNSCDGKLTYQQLKEMVENFPTADVVEVTRCKDCRHHSAAAGVCNLYLHFSVGVTANDYCSFGERRTV
jgi:hypothetical protein